MPGFKRVTGTCRWCHTDIDKMVRGRQHGYYCSHQCYYDHKHERWRVKQQQRIISRCIKRIAKTIERINTPRLKKERINKCWICQQPFIASAWRRTCSQPCHDTYTAALGVRMQRRSRIYRSIHKKGLKAADAELIDPIDVMERDGWCCKICGKQLDPALRGKPYDAAPEMDHIIPIGKGGTHTMDNVQCACRSCNIEKGESLHFIKSTEG